MTLAQMRERLTARRAELQADIATLPEVEQLQQQIDGQREGIARLKVRRDRLAAYGDKKLEIPYPDVWLPEFGQHFLIEVEPLRSSKTAKQLAAVVQASIDDHEEDIRACEREIARLLKAKR